jgi:hypothetical protein
MRILLMVALVLWLGEATRAAVKEVPVGKIWNGRISPMQAKAAPKGLYVSGPKELEKLWKEWKLAGKPPTIDWKKTIVLAVTSGGSRMSALPMLTEKGDLRAIIEATADCTPDLGLRILTVSSAGVKTIMGKVPKIVLRPEEP